jgi:hypothetical protein
LVADTISKANDNEARQFRAWGQPLLATHVVQSSVDSDAILQAGGNEGHQRSNSGRDVEHSPYTAMNSIRWHVRRIRSQRVSHSTSGCPYHMENWF